MKTKRYVPYLVVFSMIFCLFLALSAIGVLADDVEVKGDDDASVINLTQETVTPATDFEIKSYFNGEKWVNIGTKDINVVFAKLIKKDLVGFAISDKIVAKKDDETKKDVKGEPEFGAVIVKFPTIKARQALPKLVINYLIGANDDEASPTAGEFGTWTLVDKAEAEPTATYANLVGAKPENGIKFAKGEDKNFVEFAAQAVAGNKDDARENTWFVKVNAVGDATSGYTAASKVKKFTAKPASKEPNLLVKEAAFKVPGSTDKVDGIKVKKGMKYFQSVEGTPEIKDIGDGKTPITATGTYTFWTPATAKKPASIRQTGLKITAPEITIP